VCCPAEMGVRLWIETLFRLPSGEEKIFFFPENYLLFRLRPIKYNGSASRNRRFSLYLYM